MDDIQEFCEKCKLLQIDDAALGGSQCSSADGSSYLVLDDQDRPRELDTGYRFEDSFPELPRLAAGCHCCKWLMNTLRDKLEPREDAHRVILSLSYVWKLPITASFPTLPPDRGLAALLLQVDFMPTAPNIGQKEASQARISFDIDSISDSCISWLRLEHSPEPDILNVKNIEWMKKYQQRERKKWEILDHTQGKNPFLPTRLVDLGSDDQDQPSRLVLSKDILNLNSTLEIEYAALSYCWGPPAEAKFQFKTEPVTLAERLTYIDICNTTAVMKDAAKVCKALGIRYLWIDAVCIVQGDTVDWERESKQMSLIYTNATAVIASISSNSCHQGFLERSKQSMHVHFHSRINPGVSGHYILRYSQVLGNDSVRNPMLTDIAESVWDTRAWTYQESVLARFIIMFGRRKIHLVTSRGGISEGEKTFIYNFDPKIPLLDEYLKGGKHLSSKFIHNNWMEWIDEFSNKNLTNPDDKFPALWGIVAYFQDLLQDRFVAGTWLQDLYRELY
ncbi:heterokaryon incompatibility protein-domain-containing protein, partial [Whalleya microplaca]